MYAYILGLYLGDGMVTWTGRSCPWVTLYMDSSYPRIIGEAVAALDYVFPGPPARALQRKGHVAITKTDAGVLSAFPQHGPGKKHARPIRLEDWQLQVTTACPEDFLQGLIHSDGSRCINSFRTKLPSGRVAEYSYPRYFFTNYSEDIRQLFVDHCELIGVSATRSSFKNISVSRRDSVAKLDEFVGPKY